MQTEVQRKGNDKTCQDKRKANYQLRILESSPDIFKLLFFSLIHFFKSCTGALKRRQQNTARANATPLVHHSLNSRASVTPSPHGIGRGPVINPYNTSIPNPYKKSTSTTSTSNSDAKSSLARQYPHRAGRIRVDRQFSTGISIGSIGGCDWDGNEEYNRDAPQGTSVAESKNDLEDSSSLDSGGPSFSSFRGRVGGGGAKRAKFGDDTNGTFSSQSSSDDDDVLTFTPFQPED